MSLKNIKPKFDSSHITSDIFFAIIDLMNSSEVNFKWLSKVINVIKQPLFLASILFLILQIPISNLSINIAEEGFFLYSAKQIAIGKIPYRDFFMQITPGNYYLLSFFLKVFGNFVIIDRILYIVYNLGLIVILSKLFNLKRIWSYFYLIIVVFILVTPSGFFTYNSAYGIAILSYCIFKKAINKESLLYIFITGLFSGLSYIFKQNVGVFSFISLYALIILLSPKDKLFKFLIYVSVGFFIPVAIMSLHFLSNRALSDMVYYTMFFAAEFKKANFSFILHRLLFIPLFIATSVIYKKFSTRNRIILIIFASALFLLYLSTGQNRFGRFFDYLGDQSFYMQTFVYLVPLYFIQKYITPGKRIRKHSEIIMYSTFLLSFFFMSTSQGFDRNIIFSVDIFLLPLIILFKNSFVRIIILAFVILFTFPFFYNPFSTRALYLGDYPLASFNQYSDIHSVKYIKFNSEQKEEIDKVISFINSNTSEKEQILCFPYCPMIYILSDKGGATYFAIFGLSDDEGNIIQNLKTFPPKVIITIKQGNYILTPSLNIKKFDSIYSFITDNYKFFGETKNFRMYLKSK